MAHAYTVELRFEGDQLEPSEISAQLGLNPCGALSPAQAQSDKRKRRPYWGYNGDEEEGFQAEWEDLEEGLQFLLKHLAPKKAGIIALARQFKGIWWCGHFQSSFDGGATLSPELLTELGSYGIPLYIDNYSDDDEAMLRILA